MLFLRYSDKSNKDGEVDISNSTVMTIESFSEKSQAMRPMLMATARQIVGDELEAEDVVQDALLRLWQLCDEDAPNNMEGFARVVVRHMAYDSVRRRRVYISIDEVDASDILPSEGLNDAEERMMALVRQLPTMQQTVLRLRHVEEMEMGEIAELVGTTEEAVRQSLSRGRRALLCKFEQKGLRR